MSDNQTTTWLGLAWLGLAWLGLAWLGLAWLGLAVALHCSLSLSSLIFPIFCKKPLPKTGDIMPCLRLFLFIRKIMVV